MQIISKVLILFISLNLFSVFVFSFSEVSTIDKSSTIKIRFKPYIHKEINSRMLIRVLEKLDLDLDEEKLITCNTRLIRSQTLQDYFLPFYSKGHFDNCAFEKSINYINRIQIQNDSFAKEYEEELNEKDKDQERELNLLKRKILFNTGKILHAIHDFYSHSNYVELMQKEHKDFSDVPVLKIWESDTQNKIINLQAKNGLVTGTAWWVFPKKCKKDSPSHKNLAKDSPKFKAGKVKSVWLKPNSNEKFTNFEIAVKLAEESTYQFLLHTFDKYPMLKEHCGTKKSVSN